MQMNRQRWLPPSDYTEPAMARLPAEVRVTAAGLRLYVDDEGRAEVRLRRMLAELYEHDESMLAEELEEHLLRLDEAGWLRLYVDRYGRSLLQVRVWPAVQHPEPSEFPPPPGFMKPSRRSQETFMVEARAGASGRASEGTGAWVRESAAGPSRTASRDEDAPPSPSWFCSQHQPWGTEDPCGPCRTARLSRELWEEAAARVALPRPASAPVAPRPRFVGEPEEFVDEQGRVDIRYPDDPAPGWGEEF